MIFVYCTHAYCQPSRVLEIEYSCIFLPLYHRLYVHKNHFFGALGKLLLWCGASQIFFLFLGGGKKRQSTIKFICNCLQRQKRSLFMFCHCQLNIHQQTMLYRSDLLPPAANCAHIPSALHTQPQVENRDDMMSRFHFLYNEASCSTFMGSANPKPQLQN